MLQKKLVASLLALVGVGAFGAQVTQNGKDFGEFHAAIKAIHVLSDKHNGFAPTNGTGFLLKLKYETPSLLTEGLKLGSGVYLNGDAGLTTWDENTAAKGYNKGAYGLVVSEGGDTVGHLGELYVDYKNAALSVRLGRQTLDTPLTKIQISLMPNFYEAYMAAFEASKGLKLTAGVITKMSYGSRAAADSGIIGENTGTAGAVAGLIRPQPLLLNQAEFYDVSTIAGFDESTFGRGVFGISYNAIKNLKADFWLYHSDDIADDLYTELSYDIPFQDAKSMKLQTQYLLQQESGAALAGEREFGMFGAKVSFDAKKWGLFGALNSSADNSNAITGAYFNPWGADPAYTSTIFSRNAYRTDVDAYKLGGHYVLMKGLRYMVEYASYGKSKNTLGNAAGKVALADAFEVDNILVYKPANEWMFKIFHAYRVSEFDGWAAAGISSERKMSHVRVIAQYAF